MYGLNIFGTAQTHCKDASIARPEKSIAGCGLCATFTQLRTDSQDFISWSACANKQSPSGRLKSGSRTDA